MKIKHLHIPRAWFIAFFLLFVSSVNIQAQEPQLTPGEQRKYDYFFLEATNLKAIEDYSGAFELYKHALEINPNGASALYEIAQLYLYLNQLPVAVQYMQKAVANDPDNYWYAEALASLYQQRNMTKEAIDLLEQMTVRFPTKHDPLFGLMELYNREQNFDKMIETLNRLENKIGKSEQLSMEKFRIYVRQQDMNKAFDEMESLVEEYPLDMRYLTVLGDVYMQNGKPEEAYKAYQKVLEAEPDNAMALLSLTSYYDKTGQTEKYDQQLDALLMNKQVNPEIKLNIMRQFILKEEQGDKDSLEIITLFNRVIEQDMEDTQLPMLYAQYLITRNMEKESIPVLEHILKLDPSNTAARITLLGSAVRNNDSDWVIRITEPGVEINPEIIEFPFYLGVSYYQKEEYDKALEVFRKAVANPPKDVKPEVISDFYSMMGDILHTKNKMTEAFAAYDSALAYYPDNIGALNNYAYYISIQKNPQTTALDKAEEMSYKTVRKEPTNSTYLDTYAWILFVKGNYAEAKLYIDDALQNGGSESDVIVEHAGDIYYMSGDKEGALAYWKQAQDMGLNTKILKKKISKKKYIPE